MPKITKQKVHRLHIAIPHHEFTIARNLANKNSTSISEIFRIWLSSLITSLPTLEKQKLEEEKNNFREKKKLEDKIILPRI